MPPHRTRRSKRSTPRSEPLPRAGRARLSAWVLAFAGLAACGPATGADPEYWSPVPGQSAEGGGGEGGGSTGGGGATMTTSSTTTSSSTTTTTTTMELPPDPQLTVTFKTVTFNAHYAPRNVGAVWIENGSNQFVKTLELWAAKRSKYLTKWKSASAGNVVDAVTSATKSSHITHTDHWDGTDVNGNVVPDGPYHVYIEFTEYDGPGKWTQIDFEKSSTPVDLSPPDEQYFIQKHLTFTE